MAQRYLDTNPDLQHAFGRSSAVARTLAKEHYVDYGYKETSRSIDVPDWDEIWLGGYSDDWNDAEISCEGIIHLGYSYSPVDGSELDTFEKMRDFKTASKHSNGDWEWCTRDFANWGDDH
jgi:hypothetical protein